MAKFNEWYSVAMEDSIKRKAEKNVKTAFPFSKPKFSELTRNLLNDPDYEVELVKFKDNELTVEKSQPVKEFRKQMLEKVLTDNGIDKQAAADAAAKYQYSAKQADTIYPLVSEDIERYMRLGYTFKFGDKEDFNGSVYMRHVDGYEKTFRDPSSGKEVPTKIDDHKVLVKKGGAPRNCKHRIG